MKRTLYALAALCCAAAAHAEAPIKGLEALSQPDSPVASAFAGHRHGPEAPQAMIPEAEAVATVAEWFRGYEFVPTEAHFARVPNLPQVLVTLAERQDAHPVTRARAVSAMIHAPTALTEQRLLGLLESAEAPSVLRRKSARVLALSYGPRHMARIAEVFRASPQDVPLREACARALGEIGPESLELRRALLPEARIPSVKAVLEARRIR